jgi:hypothetical protein
MGIVASAKGELVKTLLDRLTHGDTGSSLLGLVAAAVVGSGVTFSDFFSTDQTKQMHAVGLSAGAAAVVVWGYYIGKKKPA